MPKYQERETWYKWRCEVTQPHYIFWSFKTNKCMEVSHLGGERITDTSYMVKDITRFHRSHHTSSVSHTLSLGLRWDYLTVKLWDALNADRDITHLCHCWTYGWLSLGLRLSSGFQSWSPQKSRCLCLRNYPRSNRSVSPYWLWATWSGW